MPKKLALHMMELMETHQSLDTFLDDDEATDAIQEEPLVNFNKFHRLHLIISELEHFRQVGYVGEKFDTRDSQVAMYEHIRRVVTYEGDSPSVPPETWNNVAKGTVKKLSSLVKW